VDKIIGCGVWVASKLNSRGERLVLSMGESIQNDKDITLKRKGRGDILSE